MKKDSDRLQLIPPYCPNPRCTFHFGTNEKFYVRNGFQRTEKAPFVNQRFRCRNCGTQFSCNTFSVDFRRRTPSLSEKVLHYSMHGMSNNSIAQLLGIAEGTVRDRLKVLARQSLIFEKENFPSRIFEDVAYDGFETFTHSQYSPCYINTAVGKRSHFIYHNTFSPLNRKGRMTEVQKIRNAELMKEHGPYPRNSVFEESVYIIKNLSVRAPGRTLFTDEHRAYTRAFRSFDSRINHETVSSKARRDPRNPLFAVNHLHLLYRHFFSSQKRETIAFQKHEGALLEKVQLMKVYRNFMCPKFVKKNRDDRHAHEWSPAMYAQVAEKVLQFDEVFGVRKLRTQVLLDEREVAFMNRSYPYSRQIIVN